MFIQLISVSLQVDVYSGGGYVVELIGSVEKLRQKLLMLKTKNWLDRSTRAIFVEFQAYNAFANLFVYVKITLEFPLTSGLMIFISRNLHRSMTN